MSQKSGSVKEPAEGGVQNIRRATRKRYSTEEKIRAVLEGLPTTRLQHQILAAYPETR